MHGYTENELTEQNYYNSKILFKIHVEVKYFIVR